MDSMSSIWNTIGSYAINLLPVSPFRNVINQLGELPALGWLNWFIPVGWIVDTMALWLTAITAYYAISIMLRWVKAIR